MSALREYLDEKRAAILRRRAKAEAGEGPDGPLRLAANVTASGRSGVRRIRIRDHQILADTPPDFAGYDFGPGSPELQLGVLGSCLTHVFLIQAADRQVPLDALSVDITAEVDYRAGQPGFEHVPVYPQKIAYTVHVDSPASPEEIAALHEAVERVCPILNLLQHPQTVTGALAHTGAAAAPALSVAAD